MALRILPLPHLVFPYNPDWVLLVLVYWCIALPERFGLGLAWVCGLFADVLTGRLLGQEALAYSVVAYFCIKFHLHLRAFPAYQQTLGVLVLLLLGQCLVLLTQHGRLAESGGWHYWLPSLTGALAWPWVFWLLRQVRRSYPAF